MRSISRITFVALALSCLFASAARAAYPLAKNGRIAFTRFDGSSETTFSS